MTDQQAETELAQVNAELNNSVVCLKPSSETKDELNSSVVKLGSKLDESSQDLERSLNASSVIDLNDISLSEITQTVALDGDKATAST